MDVVQMLFSLSKMVSATAVVMAWPGGRLDIDAPAARSVPEFASCGKEEITIRRLLIHSAGIPVMQGLSGDSEEHWKAAVAKVCARSPPKRCAASPAVRVGRRFAARQPSVP